MKRSLWFSSLMMIALLALFFVIQDGKIPFIGKIAAASDAGSVTLTEGTNVNVTVSPDHDKYIMDLQGALWLFTSDDKNAKRITDNHDDPSHPHWSSDGNQVTYQSYKDGNYHIWVMDPDGSNKKQLTTGKYDNREPRFSPDSSQIAFASDRDGSYDIWVLDVESEKISQWTDSPDEEFQPTWSPDGDEIAFASGETPEDGSFSANQIKAVDSENNDRVISEEESGKVASPSWSPNGEDIVYVHESDNESVLTNGEESITEEKDVFPFPVEWITENEIVYTTDGHVVKHNFKKGKSDTIPFEAELTIADHNYQFKDHDFDSDEKKAVKGIVTPTMSPNGEQVAFIALNDLWLLDIGKEKPEKLTDDEYYKADPAWSPDGEKLAYSSDKEGSMDIYILDLETGDESQLTNFSGAAVASAWSPDGTKIAFQDQEGATHTVNVDNGEVEEVIEALWEPGHPTWGPDSKTLSLGALKQFSERFREGTSQILNVDIESGSENFVDPIPFKSLSNRVNSGPVWSPDGKHMAFIIESTLWVMPVDKEGNATGDPEKITKEVAESPSWNEDSDRLLYLSNGDLKQVSIDGSDTQEIDFKLNWKLNQEEGRQVIHVGKLWDGVNEKIQKDMDVVVEDNRILEVKPHDEKSDEDIIDASDLTVMPGLWDSHVHQELESTFLGNRQGRQLLSFGITSTISMGDPVYLVTEDREAIDSGARVSPRLFTSGEPVDGSRVYYNFMRPTTSKEQLEDLELERAKALDYDLLKTYVRFPYKYQEEAIKAAHDMGIPTFSHYYYPSMEFGQDGTSHISASQRLDFSRTQSSSGFAYDDVVQLAAESGMSMTTTLFSSNTMLEHNSDLLEDNRIDTLYTSWQNDSLQQGYSNATTTDQTLARTSLERDVGVLKDITDAGGTILGGTDMPLVDVAVSLHLNLQAMEKYGMTAHDTLRTVTALPAEIMGVSDDLGTIEAGKLADLTFVEGNPLENMEDATNVQKVMKNGELYEVDDLLSLYNGEDEDAEDISASDILNLVKEYKENGEIEDNKETRVLNTHLKSVSHYEDEEKSKKVTKHMKGFKDLLEHYYKTELISKEAYDNLVKKSEALIKKWK